MASINNIIPNGARVVTEIGNIEAIVIGVCVRGKNNDYIEYNISRFVNGELKVDWVQSFEIKEKIDNSKPSGFVNYNNDQKLLK